MATTLQGGSAVSVGQRDNSPFGQAFRNLLIAELENRDIYASLDDPNNPLSLEWEVQRVVHQSDRTKPRPSLAEAIVAIPPSVLIDVWSGMATGPLPHSEIVLTTQLKDKSRRILSRNYTHNYIYYINDSDWHQYSSPLVPKTYAVVDR